MVPPVPRMTTCGPPEDDEKAEYCMGLQSFENWMKIQLLGIKTVDKRSEASANAQGS